MKIEKMIKNLLNDCIGNINRDNRLILPNPDSDNGWQSWRAATRNPVEKLRSE